MKIKVKDLRNLIRENYAREIPQHAVDETCLKVIKSKMNPSQAADYCRDKLEHYFEKDLSGQIDDIIFNVQKFKKYVK